MSSDVRRRSHLSRHLADLRQQRGLRPSQLAAQLGATNPSKVGCLIRSFEFGEPISDYWLEKLIAELQPDPAELLRCLELDEAEATEQLERERVAWEAWADEPIDPFLTIRYLPAVYGKRVVPKAFCNSRKEAEQWAAAELKRFGAKGVLNWNRRERTWFDQNGINPRQGAVTFDQRPEVHGRECVRKLKVVTAQQLGTEPQR